MGIILFYSINVLRCPVLKVYSNMCCSLRLPYLNYRIVGNFQRVKFSDISDIQIISENILSEFIHTYKHFLNTLRCLKGVIILIYLMLTACWLKKCPVLRLLLLIHVSPKQWRYASRNRKVASHVVSIGCIQERRKQK